MCLTSINSRYSSTVTHFLQWKLSHNRRSRTPLTTWTPGVFFSDTRSWMLTANESLQFFQFFDDGRAKISSWFQVWKPYNLDKSYYTTNLLMSSIVFIINKQYSWMSSWYYELDYFCQLPSVNLVSFAELFVIFFAP